MCMLVVFDKKTVDYKVFKHKNREEALEHFKKEFSGTSHYVCYLGDMIQL